MANTTPAWLLHSADNIQFCIGEHEAAEYIKTPLLHSVPMAPEYCRNIIFWRNKMVPLIDLNIFYDNPVIDDYQHIMVSAYQSSDNKPLEYVAFLLSSQPERILVSDDDACEIPDDYPATIKPFVLSLFNYNHQTTSVLDIAKLSSGKF